MPCASLKQRIKQSPVAEGAAHPLTIKPNPISDYVHGKEGFGDVPLKFQKEKKNHTLPITSSVR